MTTALMVHTVRCGEAQCSVVQCRAVQSQCVVWQRVQWQRVQCVGLAEAKTMLGSAARLGSAGLD